MALMVPPGPTAIIEVAPYVRRRVFRVHTCCTHCQKEKLRDVHMLDEIDGSAEETDFYASGAVRLLDPKCECGSESLTIINAVYVRQRTDV